MIRITLLTFLIAFLSAYAWKDWFKTACWLVLLMSVFQHPDMPKAIGSIPGLNHWNFLFLNVVSSWLINRKNERLQWEMPSHLNLLLFIYSTFIIVSTIRYLSDYSGVEELVNTFGGEITKGANAINEYIINCFKWVIPGMIIFDGCRSKKRYYFAVTMLALMYVVLGLQVVKAMKLGSLTMGGDALQFKALKIISKNVGFHRVNVSMMMSGAFWMLFCLKMFASRKNYWLFIIPGCCIILLAMALTGGRTGYGTWAGLGAFFCVFKWKKYLLLAPIMLVVVMAVAPSAIERLTQGFSPKESSVYGNQIEINFEEEGVDMASVTSGRIIAWPLVWESITEAPFFGYGREAMKNLGITRKIMVEYGEGETFPHPHNAYLQWIQDNGFVGAVPIFLFYIIMLKYAWRLFRDDSDDIYVVAGGMALSLILAFLIASLGSQTFYPREGAVGMWVAIGLLIRVYIEREKVLSGKSSDFLESNNGIDCSK
jgi:O-antigen ligase